MVLPFVRDLFADVEKLPGFTRVASHLKDGTGRIGVSGLLPTAKALLMVLWQRSSGRPLIVVVPDNRTAEDLVPLLKSFAECSHENIVGAPRSNVRDCLNSPRWEALCVHDRTADPDESGNDQP